jgi:hypothetical protein
VAAVDDRSDRAVRYGSVSRRLAASTDLQLLALLAEATGAKAGIGGATGTITVDGVPVFVKSVPLTDAERLPEHVGSTANLFRLPTFYQYGVGSAGFGAWREVAVHTMTTRWVLEGGFPGFPLLYHWRVLPREPSPADPAETDRWVTHWEGSPAVRARLTAIGAASAAAVLFMEHIPQTVDSWLTGQGAPDAAYLMVERELRAGTDFMASRGLVHFDAHFLNLLTDGRQVYFADFGLASHAGFDLDAAETDFFRRHRGYDRYYTAMHFAQWLVHRLAGVPWTECYEVLREHADGRPLPGVPETAARIIARHAPVAVVMGEFFHRLRTESKAAHYPAEELARLLDPPPAS